MKKRKTFDVTIAEATRTMPLAQRWLSTLLHMKTLSFISDIVSSTIARPNALLCGAILSFIVTITSYLLAKNLGYSLSGFEPMGGFLVGWTIGVLYDLIRSLVTKR